MLPLDSFGTAVKCEQCRIKTMRAMLKLKIPIRSRLGRSSELFVSLKLFQNKVNKVRLKRYEYDIPAPYIRSARGFVYE